MIFKFIVFTRYMDLTERFNNSKYGLFQSFMEFLIFSLFSKYIHYKQSEIFEAVLNNLNKT